MSKVKKTTYADPRGQQPTPPAAETMGVLPGGLRVVCHRHEGLPVVYLGLAVGVGSRHETSAEAGMAHFCEHMAFKGTRRRTAMQIINRLEGVGGELNAFTTKEDTVLSAACERRHLARAIELLTDIAFDSQYPQQEMEREVEVICDEIDSYRDTPSELIYDEFDDMLFAQHPLGHAILGDAEQLRGYSQQQLAAFARRHYRPENAVLFCWGDVTMSDLGRVKATKPALPTKPTVPPPATIPAPTPGVIRRQLGTHQAHVMVGCRACARASADRPALYLLSNLLGGPAMNARLNVVLRERRGLVYTVESSLACYADTGAWTTYLGCDQGDTEQCLRLVRQEVDRLCQHAMTERQLAAARLQLHGQVALARQNTEQMAIEMGRSVLHEGQPRSIDSFLGQVDRLTPSELQDVAQRYLDPKRLMTLIYT